MSQTRCHIKRPSASRQKSNAYDPALCGPHPGCAFVTLRRDEQIPHTEFPICTDCAGRHIEEHYAATGKAQSANLN